jgi:hypothetical protein
MGIREYEKKWIVEMEVIGMEIIGISCGLQ